MAGCVVTSCEFGSLEVALVQGGRRILGELVLWTLGLKFPQLGHPKIHGILIGCFMIFPEKNHNPLSGTLITLILGNPHGNDHEVRMLKD